MKAHRALKLIKQTTPAPARSVKYGTVTSVSPLNVLWDGETDDGAITYPAAGSYTPVVADKVVAIRSGATWLVLDSIGGGQGGPRGLITSAQRTTNSAAVSTEAVLTVNATFVLVSTRRVRYEWMGLTQASVDGAGCHLDLRRNTSDDPITVTDTRLQVADAIGGGTAHGYAVELLDAGTYTAGLTISGVGGTAQLVAAVANPCTLHVFDWGAS